MGKIELFLKLAKPNKNGVSRWVDTSEFVGEYASLKFGNGASWARANSTLCKKYIVEFDKTQTPGNGIDRIRLNGFQTKEIFSQTIRPDIVAEISKRPCVMLGVFGFSENTKIEVDHKNGRKNDIRVSDWRTQKTEDFQPLCKAANDIKRQICKNCKKTNIRWDAKNIRGNPYSFYCGNENYTEELGCVGCYQYDPVEYRIVCACKISQETIESIILKIYPDLNLEEIRKRLKKD